MEPVTCPFCSPHADAIVAMNALCYARRDKYPVARGHLLIIPFRHEPDFFSLTGEEKSAIMTLISECKMIIEENKKPRRLPYRIQCWIRCPDQAVFFGTAGKLSVYGTMPITKYNRDTWGFMDEKMTKPTWMRIAAALLLGGMIGGILFLIAVLIIGALNDLMGMTLPVDLRIAENLWSAVLLVIFIGFSIAFIWWKVETTPPSEPETPENTVPEIPDELVKKI